MAGLDVLRLLAVVLVLGRHMFFPPDVEPSGFLLTWQRGGWVGVDLFFVLSGFLVSGLLFTEYKSHGRLSIGRFYMRRGWKIYPPFFTLIAVTIAVNAIAGHSPGRRPLVSELTFVQSYMPGLWAHTWSLAVEEHFYLLLPVALTLVLRWNRRSSTPLAPVLALAVGVSTSILCLRLVHWYVQPSYAHITHLYASHLRLDALFFGVAIAYAYHFHHGRFMGLSPWRRWFMVGGALLLTPAFVFPLETTPFIFTGGLTLFYVGSGMLLVGALLSRLPRSRAIASMATLGAYSYSIYLWHLPVQRWGVPLIERVYGGPLAFGIHAAVYLIGSFVIGVAMASIVEFPVLRLRDRWFPPRSRGAIDEQPTHAPEPAVRTFGPAA